MSLILVFLLGPIVVGAGIYGLMYLITSHRATRHGIKVNEEERKQGRVFWDEPNR